jgi:hypothetical protein
VCGVRARKVNLHIEPYKDRSEKSVAGDIRYVIGMSVPIMPFPHVNMKV